ncbi:MAG: InlB B-repeat-containing protein [Lachnospiraceae bacterium]|nr:InlB B-repeat-containing protein [Lachnospiraceae bacterium]
MYRNGIFRKIAFGLLAAGLFTMAFAKYAFATETDMQEPKEEEILIGEETDDSELMGGIVTEYDLWIGDTQVTSANCKDLSDTVRGAGAAARFDPDTKTLTFRNVKGINGYATRPDAGDYQLIYSNIPLKLRGDAQLNDDKSGLDIIYAGQDLEILGNFVIEGAYEPIIVDGGLTVSGEDTELSVSYTGASSDGAAVTCSGSYKQTGGNVILSGKKGVGLRSCNDKTILSGGTFAAGGATVAIEYKELQRSNGIEITVPSEFCEDSYEDSTGTYKTLAVPHYDTYPITYEPAKTVRLEKAYDLCIGSTRVTEQNCHDLSGAVTGTGATASFDPETNTLTFHNVTGVNGHSSRAGSKEQIIYSNIPLKLCGDGQLTELGSVRNIIYAGEGLEISGNFAFKGHEPVVVYGGLKISGEDTKLSVSPAAGLADFHSAVTCYGSDGVAPYEQTGGHVIITNTKGFGLVVNDDIVITGGTFEAQGNVAAIAYGRNSELRLSNGLGVSVPSSLKEINDFAYVYYKTLAESDDSDAAAHTVRIEKAYDLWVGSTRVTEKNCWDLSGAVQGTDATAYFDPSTNTLTLRNVTGANGTHTGKNEAKCLIYSEVPLRLRGNAELDPNDTGYYAIYSTDDLDVQGVYTFKNSKGALFAIGDLTISGTGTDIKVSASTSTNALATGNGRIIIDAGTLDLTVARDGICANNDIIINGGNIKVAAFTRALICGENKSIIPGEDVKITRPENADIKNDPTLTARKTVVDGNGRVARTVEIGSDTELYTVSFRLSGMPGVRPADQIVKEGGKATEPAIPVSVGYKFTGWKTEEGEPYDFDTPVTQNLVLYADWVEAERFTVSFSANGKTALNMPSDQSVVEGGSVTKPKKDPMAGGFKFAGWYTDPACTRVFGFQTKVYAEFTLYAKWIADDTDMVRVSFDMGGYGPAIPEQIIESGQRPVRPVDPTDKKMMFAGWYTGVSHQNAYDFGRAVTENTVIYAYWVEPDPYGFIAYFDVNHDTIVYNEVYGRYEHVYTADKITPKIVVTSQDGKNTLHEGIDYTIRYVNNINVDKNGKPATVTITGKGNYAGTSTMQFYVLAKSLGSGQATPGYGISLSKVITAEGANAEPILYYNGYKLAAKDYILTSSTGSTKYKAGDVNPRLTITGKGNFSGVIRDIPVTVLTKAEKARMTIKVTLSDVKNIVYNGTEQTLTESQLIVRDGDKNIIDPENYKVVYANNKNAGTAKVTVTGIAPYTGSETKTFKIAPDKSISEMRVNLSNEEVPYVSTGARPAVTVSATRNGESKTLKEGVDYKVAFSGNTKVCTNAKANVTFMGNYAGQKAIKCTYRITPAKLTANNVRIYAADLVYVRPGKYLSVPYVTYKGVFLKNNTDYTVSYWVGDQDITNEKKYEIGDSDVKVKIRLKGKGNYQEDALDFANAYTIRKTAPAGSFDLGKAKITMKGDMRKTIPAQEYTGEAIEPEFDIYVQEGNEWKTVEAAGLTKGTDYSVDLLNNVEKGTATIFVRSMNTDKAIGSKTGTFKIGTWSFVRLIQMIFL